MSVAAPSQRAVTGWGLVVVGLVATTLFLAMASTTYDVWGAFFLAPLLIALTIPALSRQAKRENDSGLFWLLVLALVLKMFGAVLRHYVAFDLYGGVADATGYDAEGTRIAENFRAGNFDTGQDTFFDTDFIRIVTGIIYTITGPSLMSGFLFFSWLGFWGLFLFYKAFVRGVPSGRRRSYARLVFFLPSTIFWPSSIGKEAWMLLALGILSLGAAHLLSGSTATGIGVTLAGLLAAGILRPHVAGMGGLAILIGYMFRRPTRNLRELAPVARVVKFAGITLLALFLFIAAGSVFRGVDVSAGVTSALEDTAERTTRGGSSFEPPVLTNPANIPLAAWTVLFRPHPLEVDSLQAVAAAAEATFLFVLTIVRFRWLAAAVRTARRHSYVAFVIVFTLLFVFAFSSFGNFGLLTRQRVQLLPTYVVLLCIPPSAALRRDGGSEYIDREPDNS